MKNRIIQNFVVSLIIGFLTITTGLAQEEDLKNYRMLYKFSTSKQADNSRLLEVSFIARHKKDRKNKVPVFDAEINFFNVLNDEEISLGNAKTDKEGFARLILPESHSYLIDKEGYINFRASFSGTEAIKSYNKKLAIKDLVLELDLIEVDSVKTVVVNAFTIDSLQSKTPVKELDVIISVGGMISKMPIEEGTLEDGEYEFEFPNNIPGNSQGDIDVFVILEDHDVFANVIQQKTVKWGVFDKVNVEQSNTLWSEAAPIWMYVVLSILLIGVWTNYVYSIRNLLIIKKEGKALEAENKELT